MTIPRSSCYPRWLTGTTLPIALLVGGGCFTLLACEEEQVSRQASGGGGRADQALGSEEGGGNKGSPLPTPVPTQPAGGDLNKMGELAGEVASQENELPEAVFIETDENRDPFRTFLAVFTAQALPEEELAPRPPVLLEGVALDELRLIAIVSGEGGNPRAMVVDPDGKGWVVQRGDYVGRGERIRLGPGLPEREINWRVVRVRPDRIILVREDPVQAGPPVTRVIRLYPEDET